jgi:two-component sensor histidine kinase
LQRFDRHDVAFLTGFANVLAEAVATAKRNLFMRSVVERMESLVADKDRLLAEKNLLAQELHHRVRNNLQLVHAMLEKQHEQAADGAVKEAIGAISRRVMTLATIHDHLLGAGSSKTVDVGEYLKALGSACAEVEEARGRGIELTCRCEPLLLDLDTVTVLGLVTAELISNSYRHAFPDGVGTISIALKQASPAGEATLTLRDDGIGLAGNGDGNRHGLGLVDRLMQQIRGRAEVRSDHGTAWRLSFLVPRDEGSERQASAQKVRP